MGQCIPDNPLKSDWLWYLHPIIMWIGPSEAKILSSEENTRVARMKLHNLLSKQRYIPEHDTNQIVKTLNKWQLWLGLTEIRRRNFKKDTKKKERDQHKELITNFDGVWIIKHSKARAQNFLYYVTVSEHLCLCDVKVESPLSRVWHTFWGGPGKRCLLQFLLLLRLTRRSAFVSNPRARSTFRCDDRNNTRRSTKQRFNRTLFWLISIDTIVSAVKMFGNTS